MRSILTIARNAFLESVRDKVLYNLVFFALGLILFSLLLGEWSVFAKEAVIKDFTLAVMSIVGLLMAIFVPIMVFALFVPLTKIISEMGNM